MWNLNFITKENLKEHIRNTISTYEKTLDGIDLSKFNSNIVDPIKMVFDSKVYRKTFEEVIKDSEFILHVTPSKFTRSTFKQYKQYVGDKPVIICSKGFEKETLETLDEVILEEMPNAKVGVLSGPSHAE